MKMKQWSILIMGMLIFFSCAGQRPESIGVENNRLAVCPDKPNCVSSQAVDDDHLIEPFQYQGEKEAALKKLKKRIESLSRFTIVAETENYLHYECESAVMGFVDDLEFYFTEDKIIHVRSASRLGYSDFGVNRKRVEKLRKLFNSE